MKLKNKYEIVIEFLKQNNINKLSLLLLENYIKNNFKLQNINDFIYLYENFLINLKQLKLSEDFLLKRRIMVILLKILGTSKFLLPEYKTKNGGNKKLISLFLLLEK